MKIEFFATLREKFGKSIEVECDGTLRSALISAGKILGESFLVEMFDENGRYREDRMITVNGRNIKDEKIENLKEGDRIAIFPPVAGG